VSRIVLIEDNYQNARLAAKVLQRAGHEVLVAETGEEGLTTAFAENPDLILIDFGLPDIDGQTVVALLRQQAHLNATPIIAFTAWPEATAYEMMRAYGCDGVISKPIDTRNLAAQISGFLSSTELNT
jgi:two-component system, cell cycle response regulator DivK